MKRFAVIMMSVLMIVGLPAIGVSYAATSTITVSESDYNSTYKNNSNYKLISTKTYYRYRTRSKETTQSGYDTMSGYTKYDSKTSTSTSGYKFGTPVSTNTSYNSTSKVTTSAVNSGYYYYAYTAANPKKTSDWTWVYASSRDGLISYLKDPKKGYSSSVWSEGRLRYFWYVSSKDLGSQSSKLNLTVPYCEDSTVKVGTTTQSGTHKYDLPMYRYKQCYKVKTVTLTNYFYRYTDWSAWSAWSTESRSANDSQQVETKNEYTLEYTVAHEHTWNSYYTTDLDSTCTAQGVESIHCSGCGAIKEGSQRSKALKAHSWNSSYSVIKAATCTAAGVEAIKCSVCGTSKSGSERAIATKAHSWNNWHTTKAATYTQAGTQQRECSTCGRTETKTLPVLDRVDISNAAVSGIVDKTYTGKAIAQTVSVIVNGRTLTSGTDYSVKYSNNTKPGIATFVITGNNGYKGSISRSFKINPKTMNLSLKKGKKQLTAVFSYNKNKKKDNDLRKLISGIEIQYSTDKKFSKDNRLTGSFKKNVNYKKTCTLKPLQAKTTYYVRVRTFKSVKGYDDIYSKWSAIKKIKTK